MSDNPLAARRYNRAAQAKHRGSSRSPASEAEDLRILLAWEAGELTEGQAMEALKVDRLGARLRREREIEAGIGLHAAFRGARTRDGQ